MSSMPSLAGLFRSTEVLVAGDVMLDEYILGAVSRISPEAPVPVLDVRSRHSSPGGAANVAVNAAGLGASVRLAGLTGRDHAGDTLRQLLAGHSIPDRYLIYAEDRGTSSKMRIVAGQQQICRIDHEVTSCVTGVMLRRLIETVAQLMDTCSVMVLSDYAKGTITQEFCDVIIALARERKKPVIVDPKSRDFRKYRGCTVVTPNLAEALLATGISMESEQFLKRAGEALMQQLPGTSVLITCGADGMTLFENGSEPFTIPTFARAVFDVVGAGDTVVATLAVALGSGLPLREAVVWANLAAGIVVQKPGTAAIGLRELLAEAPGSDS
jgi:D-glycero-beta-D-manno-heptose-7-phosphate kinase